MANYINNKQLLLCLIEYRKKRKTDQESDDPTRIPDYVGEAVYLICTRMARRSNFCGYTYIDEMCGDAIENCVRAIRNFDPAKSNNPFGYFSRIAWRAMVRRIEAEKEQTYVKLKNFENLHVMDQTGEFAKTTEGGVRQASVGNEFTDEFIKNFERRQVDKAKRRPVRPKTKVKSK